MGIKVMQIHHIKNKGWRHVSFHFLVSVNDLFSFCLCSKMVFCPGLPPWLHSLHSILQTEIIEYNPKHQNKTRNNSIATQKKTDFLCVFVLKSKVQQRLQFRLVVEHLPSMSQSPELSVQYQTKLNQNRTRIIAKNYSSS